MTDLVACLSAGEKSWNHVARLINDGDWKKIFLVTNEFGRQSFKTEKDADFVVVDFKKPVSALINDIQNGLKGRIADFEVALNLVSGSGKEHMAILSALLKLGVGVRLTAVTKDGIKEL
ncbi:hypothetical protein HYV80_05840 [Candidatus Woesearchaeota archaeon]|nr:hypothetical protein [Candidatus Woesearchaeota archaeon]